jgi:phenylacetate-CoA ligase
MRDVGLSGLLRLAEDVAIEDGGARLEVSIPHVAKHFGVSVAAYPLLQDLSRGVRLSDLIKTGRSRGLRRDVVLSFVKTLLVAGALRAPGASEVDDEERIEHAHAKRLRDAIVDARERIPLYRDRIPSTFFLDESRPIGAQLAAVPVLTRMDLVDHCPEHMVDGGGAFRDRVRRGEIGVSRSSGSSGHPIHFFHDTRHDRYTLLKSLWLHPWVFAERRARVVHLSGLACAGGAACHAGGGIDAWHEDDHGVLVVSLGPVGRRFAPERLARLKRKIDEFSPTVILGDPEYLVRMLRSGFTPSVRLIVSSFSFLRRRVRAELEKIAPVVNWYSTSEARGIAIGCPQGWLHLNDACYYAEVLQEGVEVGPGQVGELHITTVGSPLIPLVRYATGDLIEKPREGCCACRIRSRPIGRIVGRAGPQVVSRLGHVRLLDHLDETMAQIKAIDSYKVISCGDGIVDVIIERNGEAGREQTESAVRTEFADILDVEVRDVIDRELSPEVSGKFALFGPSKNLNTIGVPEWTIGRGCDDCN